MKVGDVCKVLKRNTCGFFENRSDAVYIKITSIDSDLTSYYYDILDKEYKKISACFGCFSPIRDNDLELVNPERKEGAMRKRYILLKETYNLKKGAIFEEMCDDGTQNFKLINYPECRKYGKIGNSFVELRKCVTNNPKWFKEVKSIYLTVEEEKKFKKWLKKAK